MNAREELIRRLAIKRSRQLGSLSKEAFAELELSVRENPANFVDDAEEEAFALVGQALMRYEESLHDDDLLDDEQYMQVRGERMRRLSTACNRALEADPTCADAALLRLLATDTSPNALMGQLVQLAEQLEEREGPLTAGAAGDAWADVFCRPQLRVRAALARTCLDTARFAMCRSLCEELLAVSPLDALGNRLTYALTLARLEDEDGFEWLDAREGRKGNAWFHLSRALLMYKLGRMPAARRALRGYDQLCVGGAYILLQPIFVDTYMPDRPPYDPGSFAEAMLAAHEAEPIVADTPDFVGWAANQPGFYDSAVDYCRSNGLDWRDPSDPGFMA